MIHSTYRVMIHYCVQCYWEIGQHYSGRWIGTIYEWCYIETEMDIEREYVCRGPCTILRQFIYQCCRMQRDGRTRQTSPM